MKKLLFILFCSIMFVSCVTPKVEGVVTSIDSYGSVHTSFTIEEMLSKGFNYADIVKVNFGNTGTYIMPITTAYTEVGIGKPSYCHYSKKGEASFGYCQGNFHKMCGGDVGETVTITQYKKLGYKKEYDLVQSVYYTERDKYSSDSVFANFRMIQTPNIKPGILYRSGNPMNYVSNPGRYTYVDSLAKLVDIKSEIDIANTFVQDSIYVTDPSYTPTYCKNLLLTGHVCNLAMGSDTFCDDAYQGFAKGMRFIINNPGPYLIHCNEGKDRCGFYCILLESLTGASIKDLETDYMTTFCNLYYFEPNTEKYDFNLKLTGDRLIYLMAHPEQMQNPNIDWDKALEELPYINPKEASISYLQNKCGLTSEEILKLIDKISYNSVEQLIKTDKDYMNSIFLDNIFFESRIVLSKPFNESDDALIDEVTNVFQTNIEEGNDINTTVYLFIHNINTGELNIEVHENAFITDDLKLNIDSINIPFNKAFELARQSNYTPSKSKYITLRHGIGRYQCNPFYTIGNSELGHLWVDAITGEVMNTDPSMKENK